MKTLVIAFAMMFAAAAQAETAVQFPDLSVSQSANFKAGVETAFGHVLAFKVNGVDLLPDLNAQNPMKKQKDAAVGILSSYTWNGGLTAKMNFIFNISTKNRIKLVETLKKANPTMDVEIDYQIFAYDPEAKGFYLATKSFTMKERGVMNKKAKDLPSYKFQSLPIHGRVDKADLTVDANPSAQLTSPVTYAVHVTAEPGGFMQQNVIYAKSNDESEQIHWGRSTRP